MPNTCASMDSKTKLRLALLYGCSLLGGYFLWVYFSYLLIPFAPPHQKIQYRE